MEVFTIMRALDPEVVEVIWRAVEPLIPVRQVTHPLGCHRQRASDRACFAVMLVRLATGCSWEDAERLCGSEVSDTTVRDRRDEWIAAGVFDAIAEEAIGGYDRIIGLDLSDVSVDGCLHKAPAGGEGTGPNPTDRGKLGWKWSILTDRNGIPLGWTIDGANRNDSVLLAPTLDDAAGRCLLTEIDTLWLDRGYDSGVTRQRLAERQIDDAIIATKRKRNVSGGTTSVPMGMRWPVERTNSWLSNFGQLRRNTDRRTLHRLAQFALAIAVLLTAKLIDWRNRWSPTRTPIR
ncbi:MAG TPA: IS5 family transposase [Acidimicrobiia bacterium]|nr:IS5 family transposase [Acidimicrobiia bacterium]